jgi:hypothetical protein
MEMRKLLNKWSKDLTSRETEAREAIDLLQGILHEFFEEMFYEKGLCCHYLIQTMVMDNHPKSSNPRDISLHSRWWKDSNRFSVKDFWIKYLLQDLEDFPDIEDRAEIYKFERATIN